ncbi:MAG: hypothetical protein Q7S54_00940 [bacterium]|nr:hypothetical protein [bacterium]
MNKKVAVAVATTAALVVTGLAFFGDFNLEGARDGILPDISLGLPSFSVPSWQAPSLDSLSAGALAWATWENYLEKARNHDLAGIRALSYQISPTCNNPAQEEACFELMDSIYNFGEMLKQGDFKYIEADTKQIVMYTDGPEVGILYFTRDGKSGAPKVLGLRFCFENEPDPKESCADENVNTKDDDRDGWWNSVESLFYK